MLFALWLAALPLITFKGYYEVPKVFWLLCGGLVLLVYWLVKLVKNLEKLKITKSDKFYLIWLAISLMASLFGVNPQISVLGGSYRYQGILFFFTLWLVSKTAQQLDKNQKNFLHKAVATCVLIESVLVIAGYRIGTIGEVNAVSGFLAMGMYFVYLTWPKWILLLPLTGNFLEFSRAGLLSILGYVNLRSSRQRIIVAVVAIIFFIIFIAKYNLPKSAFEDRFVIWR